MEEMDRHNDSDEESMNLDESLGVVWKESPVEKKIQSTASQRANATELRGFVQSLMTSPSPNKQNDPSRMKFHAVSSVVEHSGIARHIIFSPDRRDMDNMKHLKRKDEKNEIPPIHSVKKQKKNEKEDEDLMSVLEKLDGEYGDTPEKKNDIKSLTNDDSFTAEDWDVIDQLEIEATQVIPSKKTNQQISPAGDILKPAPSTSHPREIPLDYRRFQTLQIDINSKERIQTIRALDESTDESCTVLLEGDWFDTPIHIGDTFHFIFTSDGSHESPLHADNENHLIVLHPDTLISPTIVTSSMSCERRGVLLQTLNLNRSSGAKALLGTLKHELFQRVLASGIHTIPYFIEQTNLIIKSNQLKLIECNLTNENANEELKKTYQSMYKWFNLAYGNGIKMKGKPENEKYRIKNVNSIEEPFWSYKYGLKGSVDACIQFEHMNSMNSMEFQIAFELKTGIPTNSIQHIGQVLLYTLLLNERYQGSSFGLLFYLKNLESIYLHPVEAHLRGLIHSRNIHASNLNKMNQNGILPALIKKKWECENCFTSSECMIHYAAIENGTDESSGVGELYRSIINDLTKEELNYFKKWLKLIQYETKPKENFLNRQNFFIKNQIKREFNEDLNCIIFQSSISGVFLDMNINDRVIISVESSTHSIFNVAKGIIYDIQPYSLSVKLLKKIPRCILNGKSIVGNKFEYYFDKDIFYNNFQNGKKNLILFLLNKKNIKLRKLICHKKKPFFIKSSTIKNKITCQILLNDFLKLNKNQQNAIEKVLNSKDYSLILGMPGTGKTSCIVILVRILVSLGYSILLTSYTHSAVDNMMIKLIPYLNSMLRIGGTPEIINKKILPFRFETKKFNSTNEMENEILKNKIIGCTCLSINHILFQKKKFDFCIVDEASQITQPVLLGALQYSNIFCLVGDHYQLAPLVLNKKAKENGFDLSLFKYLSQCYPDACTVLKYQYRMNNDIMLLANRLIYNNQLKKNILFYNNNIINNNMNNWIDNILNKNNHVLFLNTDLIGYHEEKTKNGIKNSIECHLVHGITKLLNNIDLTILSPFRSQVNYLKQYQCNNEISTIDTYQGKDKDCIIISFVRSNKDGHVGEILLDWRRINVAITRSKNKLIFIGSINTLIHSPILNELILILNEKKWIINIPKDYFNKLPKIILIKNKKNYKILQNKNDIEDIIPQFLLNN